MQRMGAFTGVVAVFIALLTSPLYHFHGHDDDHGHTASVTHAHFLEPHEAEHHSEDSFEGAHASHERARWVEFFVFNAPSAVFDLTIDLTESLTFVPILERHGTVLAAVPNAHGPPGERPSIPRSPPAI
jgi:hypothetical protein